MNTLTNQELCWHRNLGRSMVVLWRFTLMTRTQTTSSSLNSPTPWCSQHQQSRVEAPLNEPRDHPKGNLVQFIQILEEMIVSPDGAELSHQLPFHLLQLELTSLTNFQRTLEGATSLQRGDPEPSSYRQWVVTEAQRVQEGKMFLTWQTTRRSRESKTLKASMLLGRSWEKANSESWRSVSIEIAVKPLPWRSSIRN